MAGETKRRLDALTDALEGLAERNEALAGAHIAALSVFEWVAVETCRASGDRVDAIGRLVEYVEQRISAIPASASERERRVAAEVLRELVAKVRGKVLPT